MVESGRIGLRSPWSGGGDSTVRLNRHYLWALLIIASWLALAFYMIHPDVAGLIHDDGIYLITAKALATGQGYRIISLPEPLAQTKYPILFPLMLAPIWRVFPEFPENIVVFKSLMVLFGAGFLGLSYLFFLHALKLGPRVALALLGVLAIAPYYLGLSQSVMSEVPFGLFTLLTLFLFQRWSDRRDGLTRWQIVVTAVLCASSCLIRANGTALVFAIAAQLAVLKRGRQLIGFLILSGAFLAPWFVWVTINRDQTASPLLQYYVSYKSSMLTLDEVADVPRAILMVFDNILFLFRTLDRFIFNFFPLGYLPLRTAVGGFFILGLLYFTRRDKVVFPCYLLVCLLSILLVPWKAVRHFVPLVPIILAYAFMGAGHVHRLLTVSVAGSSKGVREVCRSIPFAFLVVLLTANAISLGVGISHRDRELVYRYSFPWPGDARWAGFQETFRWVMGNIPPADTISGINDPVYYLYTGRHGVRFNLHVPESYFYPEIGEKEPEPSLGDQEVIFSSLRAAGVRWLIYEPSESLFAVWNRPLDRVVPELSRSASPRFKLVFVSSDLAHLVYRIDWEP